jgi:CHASE2 domain-containing sensor protein
MVLSALPTTVTMIVLMAVLEHLGWLRGFETAALDSMLRLHSVAPKSNVLLVTIDDQDYRELFGGVSPLQSERLLEVLQAVQAGKPRVIGVDVETSAPAFAGKPWPQAVWARDAEVLCDEQGHESNGECEADNLQRFSLLGGDVQERLQGKHIQTVPASGLVIFPQDYDGVVRRYKRFFHSSQAQPKSDVAGNVDTLPWAIVKAYVETRRAEEGKNCRECDRIDATTAAQGDELVLNFAGDRYHFAELPARHLLTAAKKDYWATKSPCRDAIVIVGGTYRAARDAYATPVGMRSGMQIIAQAVESDLQGRGIRELNYWLANLLEYLNSLLIIFLAWRFPTRFGVLASLCTTIVLSIIASHLAFHTGGLWFNFSAVLIATWLHLLWEQSKEHRELRHELEHLRAEKTL